MKLIPVPPQRSSLKSFQYYFFRFFGPFLLVFGPLAMATMAWLTTLTKLTTVFPLWFLCILFIITLLPLLFYIYCVFYTVLGDVGETANALKLKANQTFLTESFLASLPTCQKCGLPKPARCHHCSLCNKCHLRMDHHCPAIGTCIALKNTQPFIVMLKWAEVTMFFFICLFILSIYFEAENRLVNCTFLIAVIVLYAVVSSFLSDFMTKVRRNITTIEMLKSTPGVSYDLGSEKNLAQVLGTGKYRTWIPRKCRMNGFEWCAMEYRQDDNLSNAPPEPLCQPFPKV